MITCPECNRSYKIKVSVWPLHCACGTRIYESGETVSPDTPELVCKYRRSEIGKMDCGCAGDHPVYQCTLFDLPCSIRKLKPGQQYGQIGGQKIEVDLFCNACESWEA